MEDSMHWVIDMLIDVVKKKNSQILLNAAGCTTKSRKYRNMESNCRRWTLLANWTMCRASVTLIEQTNYNVTQTTIWSSTPSYTASYKTKDLLGIGLIRGPGPRFCWNTVESPDYFVRAEHTEEHVPHVGSQRTHSY